MGNLNSIGQQEMVERMLMKRNESFGSKSPRRTNKNAQIEQQQKNGETNGGQIRQREKELDRANASRGRRTVAEEQPNDMATLARQQQQHQLIRYNRSHSLEQSPWETAITNKNPPKLRLQPKGMAKDRRDLNGMHSPSSSRSSSSNSYINSVLSANCAIGGEAEKNCLRQSTEPMFNISGNLNPHQIGLVRRAWKATLKAADNEETEIAIRILLRIFQLDTRNLSLFYLRDLPTRDFRRHTMFMELVNIFEPILVHVMGHLTNATTLSKHLQQLGGRHVSYTGVTYKCAYWKSFAQALVDVMMENGGKSAELRDALIALGDFCVEQMKIGYRIEHKLQSEAERLAQKRRRAFVPTRKSPI